MIRYIYEIKNNINGKTYFGKHSTNNINDGYMGSGTLLKRAKTKYGKNNFEKIIIISGNFSLEQINRFEKCIIRVQKFLGKAEYNIAKGGDGGKTSEWNKEQRNKQREISLNIWKTRPEIYQNAKKLWSKHMIEQHLSGTFKGDKNGMYGKHHTKETRQIISEKVSGNKNGSFGKHWYTNGIEEAKLLECPEGWHKGRLSSKQKIKKRKTATKIPMR